MAVLMFCKSTDKLNFSMANLKRSQDFEGFFLHRIYECSAMIAVAEQ